MWWRLGAGSPAAPEPRPRRVNSTPPQPHPPHAQDHPLAEWLLLGCGVVAAMHVGKLPPALPVLRQQLGVSLVEAGFLLSTVQLGSMLLGLALGLGAHRFGLRRSLLGGLWLLVLASLAGTQATGAQGLLAARAAEGVGVLLVALSAPSLLRRIVPAHRQSLRLGLSEATAEEILAADAVHPVSSVQSELSLWTDENVVNGVLALTQERGIGFLAYCPLGRGFLTGALTAETIGEGDFRSANPRFTPEAMAANSAIVDGVRMVAERRGVTAAQVSLAWVLAQGEHVVPIPGTKRRRWLEENAAAVNVRLSTTDLGDLAALPRSVAPRY